MEQITLRCLFMMPIWGVLLSLAQSTHIVSVMTADVQPKVRPVTLICDLHRGIASVQMDPPECVAMRRRALGIPIL